MSDPASPAEKGSLAFFASWLLLHEKADDWIGQASAHNVEVVDQALNGQ